MEATMATMLESLKADMEKEAATTRRCLERVPDGQKDWKPHEKSMPLGYLASLLAVMPSWLDAIINHDEGTNSRISTPARTA
jgi:hypothetical protein